MQCQWTKLKETTLEGYKPVGLKHFCCTKKLESQLEILNDEEIRLILLPKHNKYDYFNKFDCITFNL